MRFSQVSAPKPGLERALHLLPNSLADGFEVGEVRRQGSVAEEQFASWQQAANYFLYA